MKGSAENSWFKKGLKFTCTQCGDCCTGAPGFVWVNEPEVEQLAIRCGESVERFRQMYVRTVGKRESLKELEDGSCVFFRPGLGCTVYEQRPRQCRTWPFWNSNLETKQDWDRTCEICPGSGVGELHTVEEILEKTRLIKV